MPHVTLKPLLDATMAPGRRLDTEAYDIYRRVEPWDDEHEHVCHGEGAYARDEDGDGFHEVHVHPMEGVWSLLRSWLRPHHGMSQENLPLDWGFFAFVHHVRRRGNALVGALLELLLA